MGTVLALMAPVALLLVATIVVLATAEEQVDHYGITDGGLPGVNGTDSQWSYRYAGGDPVGPPTSDDAEFESQ